MQADSGTVSVLGPESSFNSDSSVSTPNDEFARAPKSTSIKTHKTTAHKNEKKNKIMNVREVFSGKSPGLSIRISPSVVNCHPQFDGSNVLFSQICL